MVDQMLQNSTKEFYAFDRRTILIQRNTYFNSTNYLYNEIIILIQRIICIFNEIIILIQRIIYIFNEILILIQRIIYIFNEMIIWIQRIIYTTK